MCVSVKYHLLHLRLNDLSVELLKTHLSYILSEPASDLDDWNIFI